MLLARASAVPVWLPKRMSKDFASALLEVGAARASSAYANKPAKYPFNHARCSAVNGADAGMHGTGWALCDIIETARCAFAIFQAAEIPINLGASSSR